jgi:hypothetical protein
VHSTVVVEEHAVKAEDLFVNAALLAGGSFVFVLLDLMSIPLQLSASYCDHTWDCLV